MIDDEHVGDVGHGLGQGADDLDRFLDGCAFEHCRIFRLHQAARRVRRVAQELLDPRGQGPGQAGENTLRTFLRDRAQQIGGVVRVQLLQDLPQVVVGQVLDDLRAGERRDQSQDCRGDVRRENAKEPVPDLGPLEQVDELSHIGRMQRGHRLLDIARRARSRQGRSTAQRCRPLGSRLVLVRHSWSCSDGSALPFDSPESFARSGQGRPFDSPDHSHARSFSRNDTTRSGHPAPPRASARARCSG